jgi:hypothetical protein|tara:strand:- start:1362 stop:1808 length:447 start_codon:yes stop_codon:yes gene_type:complete
MYKPPDYGGYTRQKADVEYQYGNDAIQNAYGRFLGQQRFTRDRGDDQRSFGRQYAPNAASFGQRGLSGAGINSGIRDQKMGEYVGDYGRGQQRAYQDQTMQNQQYDLSQAQSDQWRQQALQGIETQKANDIAWTAQNITELRNQLGGL